MKLAIIHHVSFERFPIELLPSNCDALSIDLYSGASFPDSSTVDGLIVMGGPMGVHDDRLYPWLQDEKKFIKQLIDEEKPVLGICLGAQLIASVLGAQVRRNHEQEIGFFPVVFGEDTLSHPLFKGLASSVNLFHWHGDTFELPDECLLLGSSEVCKNQGFLVGDKVLALQFHFEVDKAAVLSLLENCYQESIKGSYIDSYSNILNQAESCTRQSRKFFSQLLVRFFQ